MPLFRRVLPARSARTLWGALVAALVLATTSFAQFTYSEDFKNSTAAGWVLNPAGNSTPNVTLTSGAAPRSGDPETGSVIDPSGSGWMRLTNNTLNTHNAVYFDTPIPSAGNSVTIGFGVNLWGGNNFNSTGADGLTFFLYDASKNFQVGADGGSMGYAQKTGVNGLNGGFVAVALDAYGNFSVAGEGRQGGTAALQANSVSVRGPGQGTTGYNYLAGTGNRDYTDTGSPTVQDVGDGTVPALPYTMGFPTATVRPNQSTQYRNVSITINESSQLLVSMQFGEDGLWYNLLNVNLSSFVRPEQLKMGFSAGTGSGTMITEVGGLLQITATAGSGNFIWDNRNGPGDSGGGNSVWGTGANDPLNWAGQTNPTLKSNVLFNSTYVSSAQNINVTGSDKVITNMYLSGVNAYTFSTSEGRKLIFDSTTVGGLTAINLTSDAGGNASHTIGLDIQMNRNLDVNNNISYQTPQFNQLTISGNIDTGGNILGLKGTGMTVLAGAISGSGSLVKSDSGTAVLSGTNTYSGTTTVNAGILQIENATALGSTAAGTTVNSGGTLALAGAGTTFAAEALTINGTGVNNAGALLNSTGVNTWTGNVALGTTGTNSIGVNGGSLEITGVVSGASGNNLTKVGSGTLTLSGTNTFSGSTTVNAGTVAIGADSGLGTAPGVATAGQLTLDGGTLQSTATFELNANRGIALGASGGTINTNSGTTLTYNGIAAGSGSLTKAGTGILSLGGTNTYTGATNINAGTLRLTADNTLSNSTAVIVAGIATFDVNSRTDTVGSLAGSGSVTLGSGSLSIGTDNTNTTFSGIASGTGNILKTGTGTTTFSGANTFTGNLQINQGTVALGANNVFTSSLVLNGGTFSTNGNSDTVNGLSLLSSSAINFNSLAGLLGVGTGAYTGGTLTISNWAGSPTGGGASQLLVNSLTAFNTTFLNNVVFTGFGTGAKIIDRGGGVFEVVPNTGAAYTWGNTGSGTWAGGTNWKDAANLSVTNPGGTGTTSVFGTAITANSTVTLDAARSAGYLVFSGSNGYTITPSSNERITMAVSGGSASISTSNTGVNTIGAGLTLSNDLIINQNSTGDLTLNAANAITGTDKNVTVGGSGNTLISGTITTGAGGLTMNGTGVLTLAADNTYTGKTAINSGTIAISNANQIGDAPATAVADQITLNGGTLRSFTSAVNFAADNRGFTLGTNGGTFETVTDMTISNVIAGTGSLTKTGASTLFLGAANTYTGATNVNAGTLAYTGTNRISDSSAVNVASGATLDLVQYSDTVGSIAGAGNITATGTGALTLTFGGLNSNTTLSGNIADGASATLSLVKNGTGTTVLSGSGSNTFDGTVTINSGGALNIQKNSALGSTTGGTTVASGGALEVQGGITVTGEALNLSGTGVGTNGALRNVSGNNTLTGIITLGAATTVKSDADTLTLSTGGITATNQNLTVTGSGNTAISGVVSTGTGTLTKSGTGTLTLSGANTFTGVTTVSAGTIEVQNATGLGTNAAGTTVSSGATLSFGGSTFTSSEGLTLAGQGVGGNGALRNLNADHTLSGNIALSAESYIGVAAGTNLTASGVVSGTGFGLTKLDTGTLVLSGINTYTGTTAISAGTVQLSGAGTLGTSAAPTTISNGATLALSSLSGSSAENITVTGAGVSGAGAIQSIAGSNTISGNITTTGDTTIGVSAGSSLTASGNITGNYSVVKTGAGALTLSGTANAYTGTTTLRNGNLTVTTNAPVSANGSLGNSGSTVQLGDSGTGTSDNLALLIGNATGGVSIDRSISVNGQNSSGTTTLGGTNTSGTNTFNGNIGFGRDATVIAAAGGTVAFTGDLAGSAALTAGSAGNTGTVILSGSNSLTGATTVAYGTLVAASSGALGTTDGATTVNSGATLGLQGNITVPSGEGLTLSGTGVSNNGALRNLSGDNSVAGPITLAADTTVGMTAGNLTLAGAIGESGGSRNLTTVGTGNVNLTGASSFSGNLTLNGGAGSIVTLNNATGALGNVGNITVNAGNTLTLGAANQINNNANLTLAGGTFNVGSFSEQLRQLSTNTATSAIDFLNDGSVLRFNGATGVSGLGTLATALNIDNWSGSLTGKGSEQLVVYSASGAPTVSSITFTGWGAATTIDRSSDLGTGFYEIVPSSTGTAWNVNGNGTWSTNGNWNPNSAFPNAQNAIAIMGNVNGTLSTNPTVTLANTNRTVGKLIFDSTVGSTAYNYTISSTGSGHLILNSSSGPAQIIVNDNGAHSITLPTDYTSAATITNTSSAATGLSLTNTLTTNFTGNLTVAGSGTTSISGAISQNTGTAGVLKTGTGTLILGSASSNYTGTTTVRDGTLQINANAASGAIGALGNSTGAVVVNDANTTSTMNTSLLIGASAVTVGRAVTVNSTGGNTTLGGNFASGNSTFSGAITLNKGVNLTAAGTSNVTFSGQLTAGTGTSNITKTGSGTVILSNTANNFNGTTLIDAGTLRLGASEVITNTSAVSITSGATFDLNGFSETIGSLAGAGNVTGTSGTNTLTAGQNNSSTTFSGIISDGTGTLALTKTGTGTMTLTGANTYDGVTTVSAGTLVAANNTALGSATGATTVTAGATLGLQGDITVTGEAMTLNTNSGSPSTAALANLSGINTSTGAITLTANTANDAVKIDSAGGSQLTLSGAIGQGANAAVLSKTGTGTLVLSGANTYTGATNIAAGTLVVANNSALGTTAAGTTVQIGATLGVQGNVTVASGETYTLNGTAAPPSAPSIKNIADTNTLAGNITLSGGINTGVAIDSNTGSLTLSGAITQAANANYVNKTGAGDLILGGSTSNTFTGGFNINDGRVIASKSAGDATGAAAVNIGDGIGSAASAILQLNASNQINTSSAVTIQTDGRLDLQANNNTIGALTMSGGNVQGTGTLTLGNNFTFNGVGTTTASVTANLDLGSANLSSGSRIVQVGNNGVNGDVDLTINSTIGGGTTAFKKTDLGTLALTGTSSNTFSGGFQVADGTVLLNKTDGQNATGSGSVTVGDGSGAANSANLKLLASNQIANTASVTINSDGNFNLNGLTETIGAFAGTGTVDTGAGTLIVAGNNSVSSFGGTLAGLSTGKIVIDADQDHNGTAAVPSGSLAFTSTINFAGELELKSGILYLPTAPGSRVTLGTLHITGDTILDFGNSAATMLDVTNIRLDPGVTLTITNWVNGVDYFFAQNWLAGTVIPGYNTRGVGDETQIVFTGYSGNSTAWLDYGSKHEITPAPEPATYGAMMIGGALGLLGYRRWRSKKPTAAT